MEDMNFAPKYIDAQTTTSSDGSIEKSIDTPLASKYVLTCFDNEKVVVGDQKGRVCNASNQINYRHRAPIPIGVAVVLNAGRSITERLEIATDLIGSTLTCLRSVLQQFKEKTLN